MDAQRALLDSLMGASRNDAKASKEHYTDRNVCKFWLIDFCPHECFHTSVTGKAAVNSPLGECPKQHSMHLKTQFQEDTKDGEKNRREYEKDLLKYLDRMVSECDAKVQRERRHLESKGSLTKIRRHAGLTPMNQEQLVEHKIIQLKQTIQEKIKAAELLAEDGKLKESQEIMAEVESLKATMVQQGAAAKPASLGVEGLDDTFQEDVCDVCGLTIDWRCAMEIENRRKGIPHPHTSGTYHQGYAMMRKKLLELKEKYGEPDRDEMVFKTNGRDRERERDRRGDRRRDQSRTRDRRERSRDRGGRNYSARDERGGGRGDRRGGYRDRY
ncbi:unnamed protein product [Amoebophrya sp. A120]|nr:unnamed protein product [Amoebophrya sp. A120]|eukprot:GSA120T00011554001.1